MMAVEAMTRANCRKSCPVMPGMKAAGRNTAVSTRVMPMTGPVSSLMALMAASCGGEPCLDVMRGVFDDDDGVVHHDADGQDQGEQGHQIDA